jgi:hypothetical protein
MTNLQRIEQLKKLWEIAESFADEKEDLIEFISAITALLEITAHKIGFSLDDVISALKKGWDK